MLRVWCAGPVWLRLRKTDPPVIVSRMAANACSGLAVWILTMIKKLPLGVSGFADVRRYPGYLYVDKTRLLAALFPAHGLEKRHLCLARPRRFGKTLLVSTLEALFQGRRKLFTDMWIGQAGHWDWERNRHAVLRLSLALRNLHDVGQWERALSWHMRRQARVHRLPHDPALTPEQQLEDLIQDLAAQSGGQIVVLVDEYDMAITENLGRAEVLGDILDVMRAFYGALKAQSDCIHYTLPHGHHPLLAHRSVLRGQPLDGPVLPPGSTPCWDSPQRRCMATPTWPRWWPIVRAAPPTRMRPWPISLVLIIIPLHPSGAGLDGQCPIFGQLLGGRVETDHRDAWGRGLPDTGPAGPPSGRRTPRSAWGCAMPSSATA